MNVQWEDENLGESICNALKKEEVTYADIEGITGISIDSQYVVKLDWKDKTEQYVYNSGNDMCEILELQDFSTLADLKKFPYLRELYLKIREFEYGDVYRKKYREKSSVLLWTGVFQ